jgi:hypothetical protein
VLLSKLDKLLVGNTTSANQNHTVSRVVCLDIVDQVISLNGLNVLGGTQNRTSQWLTLEGCRVQVIEHNFLQLLVYLLRLSQDNVTLALNGLRLEFGVLENIGEDVDGRGYVCVKCLGVIDSVLTLQSLLASAMLIRQTLTYRCIGVEVTTHILDFQLQLLLRSVACALNPWLALTSPLCRSIELYLEGKMFQEVSGAIGLVCFRPRSSINPHTDRRRLGPWRMLCSNLCII